MIKHTPVLLKPVLKALLPAERIIDGTLGAGGHSLAFLEAGAKEILGLDRDTTALEIARVNLAPFNQRVHLVHASYLEMVEQAHQLGWEQVDGILLDLGLSSMQLDTPERGFAFTHDGPLDMRFDVQRSQPTAADLVNTLDESELSDLFYTYGEEPKGRHLARAIIRARPFETTRQLAQAIEKANPRRNGDRIHPATRVFQALRIAVNDELKAVEMVIPLAIELLKPGGHLAVISFHSLEDRIVKEAFKLASTDCICPPKIPVCACGHKASVRLVNRKPIEATSEEIAANPRSRSAKMRVAEKIG